MKTTCECGQKECQVSSPTPETLTSCCVQFSLGVSQGLQELGLSVNFGALSGMGYTCAISTQQGLPAFLHC